MGLFSNSVRVGSSKHKNSPFNLSTTISTTSDFCFCQPLNIQEVIPGSHISISSGQLISCNAMPLPTFGMVNMNIYHRFVPIAELWHPFEYMLTQKEYGVTNPYIPTSVPKVSIAALTMYVIFNYSGIEFYRQEGGTSSLTYQKMPDSNSWVVYKNQFVQSYNQSNVVTTESIDALFGNVDGQPTIGSADFVLSFGTDDGNVFAAVHLNEKGLKLRKILNGLGYTLNPTCNDLVSILPLFAYYRAYWDQFLHIHNYTWEKTACHKMLYAIENGGLVNISQPLFATNGSMHANWNSFLGDLLDTYYTYPQDFIASHISSPSLSPSFGLDTTNVNSLGIAGTQIGNSNNGQVVAFSSSVSASTLSSLTQARLDLLQRLTTIVNKNTILGGRIQKLLKSVFGADFQMKDDSNFIGSFSCSCDFEEVMNTADTEQGNVGEFSGKGRANNRQDKPFTFNTDTFGYVISFMCVVPEGDYGEGLNPALYHTTWDTFYRPELDGLGYEISPKTLVQGAREFSFSGTSTPSQSFGFIPRMSSYKYAMNRLNGDLTRASFRDSLLAYTLDPYILQDKVTSEVHSDNPLMYDIKVDSTSIPIADPAWRFRGKFAWMSNFNRIFYNGNLQTPTVMWQYPADYSTYYVIDNFNVNVHINLKVDAPMLSAGDSYDTDSFENYAIEVSKA